MKLLSLFLIAMAALAQSSAPSPAPRYLVEYTTSEKCYTCGYSYAVVCGSGDSDCNAPVMPVSHFEEFATVKEALHFINSGMGPEWGVTGGLTLTYPARQERTFKRLLTVLEVPVDKEVSVVEEPQPPKRNETVKYHLGDEYGEEPNPDPVGSIGSSSSGTLFRAGAMASTTGNVLILGSSDMSADVCAQIADDGRTLKFSACPALPPKNAKAKK